MRIVAAFLTLILSMGFARADALPPTFPAAKQAFESLPLNERVNREILLSAASFWPAVPNTRYGRRLFEAFGQFQAANGFAATGILDGTQLDRLRQIAGPRLAQWGFRPVLHPDRPYALWVPMGLGLSMQRTQHGLHFADPQGRLMLDYEFYRDSALDRAFATWLDTITKTGADIHMQIIKPDFFAIAASSSAVSFYIRFQRDGDGILGFALLADNTNDDRHNSELQTIVSASMWSAMTPNAPFMPLPDVTGFTPTPATPRPVQASTPAPPPPVAPPAPPGAEQSSYASGTGFFVASDGAVLTNAHVVAGCSTVSIGRPGGFVPVTVVARDKSNDLALLKTGLVPPKIAQFRPTIRLGEQVAAFGYPLSDILASSGNFTLGYVTATAGLDDDSRYLQISAPVQPGNSGGPLVDISGNLVGVVSAKLNAARVMADSENHDIAQNVNFAIKSSVAQTFLEGNEVKVQIGTPGTALQSADLAELTKALSVFILCKMGQ